MYKEVIVLDDLIFERGMEVNKSKIDVITSLSYPSSVTKCIHFVGM